MSQYFSILLWIGFVAALASFTKFKSPTYVLGTYTLRTSHLFAFLGFLPVILMAGTRGYIGDTYNYVRSFTEAVSSLNDLGTYLDGISKDYGFSIFTVFVKSIIGDQKVLYLLIIASIQGLSLLSIYRRYSVSYFTSIFLFVASTDYISWMFNGIRQFMAVTIIFAATTLMIQKKYLPSILVILLASTFHGSALLMLPILFVVQGKAFNKKTLFITFLCLIALFFANQFTDIMDFLLSDTQYKNVVSDWESFNDDGTNPLRVLVYSVPTFLAIFGFKFIRKANDPVINFCANMSFISTAIYAISMVTSGIFIGRIPIYFSLYNYILLPWEIQTIFAKNSQKIIQLLMILGYLVFYIYQMGLYGLL